MPKLTIIFLFTTITLIGLSVLFDVPFLRGGSGLIFVAALVYSYIVAKREVDLLAYAMNEAETGRG